MNAAYQPPTGRLKAKARSFEEVVRDIRHIVFSVVRHRPINGGAQRQSKAMGSGFFVSPKVFLTCNHVINPTEYPLQDGDYVDLVSSLEQNNFAYHTVAKLEIGKQLYLYPEDDLALIIADGRKDQPYAALDYSDVHAGKEIGVAGYPLPVLTSDSAGLLSYGSLIFRVARGVVTATYTTTLQLEAANVPNASVVEVNFMFVMGNSGGPIFDASSGRVLAFVHGFIAPKVRERVESVTMIKGGVPDGLPSKYIENLNAIYSLGIKLDRVRAQLENLGITL